jgi:hypothetical protein
MRILALLALALAGCATGSMDPHRWKTVVAPAEGGEVTVSHGSRLRLPLAADPSGAYEWRRVEPEILRVVSQGLTNPDGIDFTPVRSGEEKLRLEYRPLAGGEAQRSVSYVVTVPDDKGFYRRWFPGSLP